MGELDETETEHESTTSPTAATTLPKQSLGRYEIESVLGAGGMGVVYAAFDPELQRRVAVKLLPDAKRSQSARERLLREARAMARLTHPNVVRVYEVDSVDDHDFVAMELVEGDTLAAWMRATKRSPDEVLARFIPAGRGLAAAHAAGVVHRDFKPHNVLCGTDGRILVTDFGLAREVDAGRDSGERIPNTPPSRKTPLNDITEEGSVLGTPAYMAPEQRAGGQVGAAADQFAFCVALWEALTGKRPYRGNADEIRAAYERGPAGLDASAVPRRLRGPLLRGLEIDPAKRWPSMDALLRQLSLGTRRRTALAMTFAAVAVASVTSALIARNHSEPCGAPVLDPAAVWSSADSAKLGPSIQRSLPRRLDHELASWRQVREHACHAERTIREAQLACLDGVLARLDVTLRAAKTTGGRFDTEDLVEPTVCASTSPPRLRHAFAPEFRDTLEVAMTNALTRKRYDAAVLDQITAHAKSEPCASAFAFLIRAHAAESAVDLVGAMREAERYAEQCGDDHLIATILVFGAVADGDMGSDVHKERAARARTAVRRIPTSDLEAKIDVLTIYEDLRDGKLDSAIGHAQSAVDKLEARGSISAATEASMALIGLRASRGSPADMEAVPRLIDHYHSMILTELGLDSRERREIDMLRAQWLWSTDRLDEAHAVADAALEDWPLIKPLRMHARVVDKTGSPVAGATITAAFDLRSDSRRAAFTFTLGAELRSAKTDEHGDASFDVESKAIAIADLGQQRSQPMAVGENVTFVLEPTSRISGKVALNRIAPTIVTVQARAPNDDPTVKQWATAPVRSDGTFEIAGIRHGRVQIRAGHGELGVSSGNSQTIDVDQPEVTGVELAVGGAERMVNVLVRSTVASPVAEASVTVYPDSVKATNLRMLNDAPAAITGGRGQNRELSTLPKDIQALARPGDLLAAIDHVPAQAVTVCAMGFPHQRDISDHVREELRAHPERVEVRCAQVAADARLLVIEVPPFPRFD